ncbi:MAG: polyhydroxyalkanoate synthesis repressor PhaR [Legionellales bacterium]|nr:polyhydroxyalkanoate synthesis repressor PhaR [Legionellales bacterium]
MDQENKKIRIIKKYPNRRLYDTAISRYITLQDIKQLVLDCEEIKVIDAKSEEDLTNMTLLQIIVEQEDQQTPMFTRDILQNLIRGYNHSMQTMMSNYLEQSVNLFMEQAQQVQQGVNNWLERTPLNLFSQLTERNLHLWKTLQENWLNAAKINESGEEAKKSTTKD